MKATKAVGIAEGHTRGQRQARRKEIVIEARYRDRIDKQQLASIAWVDTLASFLHPPSVTDMSQSHPENKDQKSITVL